MSTPEFLAWHDQRMKQIATVIPILRRGKGTKR